MNETADQLNGRQPTLFAENLQLGPLLFLTAIFWMGFVARIIWSPLLPTIEKDLNISHTTAGSLFLYVSIGYLTGLLGSGFISSWITHRKAVILSAIIVGGALIWIALWQGFWALQSGLFILGLGSGLYLPSGIATITALVQPQHWGKALAVHELAPVLAFISSPLASELLLRTYSWRGVVAIVGIGSLLSGITFIFFGRGGDFPGEQPNLKSARLLFSEPSFWIMAVLFCLGVSSTIGIYTMIPLYLVVDHGLNRSFVNFLFSLSRLPTIGTIFFAGWARDRFGSKTTLAWVFFLGCFATIIMGIAPANLVMIMMFVQPLIASSFFPAGFSALSGIGPPSVRNISVSFTLPISMAIGGGVIPTWIGFMGDRGSFGFGIAVAGSLLFVGTVLARFLRLEGEAHK